ncbi:MAG: CvpA family protein [Terriglobales bacterium]
MNLLDYILLLILVVSIITAAVKGFFYEVWMMAAAIAAIVLAVWQYRAAAAWFHWLGVPAAAHVCGFVLILVAVLIAAVLVGRLGRSALHAVGLKLPDRLLGAGLGLIRGLLLCAALVTIMVAYPFHPALVRQSHLAPGFLWGGRAFQRVMPAELEAHFQHGLATVTTSVRELP